MEADKGFRDAFYEIAGLLGIPTPQSVSPKSVYETQVKPRIVELIDGDKMKCRWLELADELENAKASSHLGSLHAAGVVAGCRTAAYRIRQLAEGRDELVDQRVIRALHLAVGLNPDKPDGDALLAKVCALLQALATNPESK